VLSLDFVNNEGGDGGTELQS
jgi:hypothetical protein